MGVISVLIVVMGYLVSFLFATEYFFTIMAISIVFSLGYTWIGYYFSDKIALASVRAKPASRTQHAAYYAASERVAREAGVPMPRLYVMESQEINAFASGRSPQHAVMCFTTASLNKLSDSELEGVIAHEMAHIKNYDIRYMTLAVVLIGMLSIIAQFFLRSLWFSGDRDNRGAGMWLMIVGIVFAILAPIAAQLVSLALSRKREFLADATSVAFTHNPKGLAHALKKIKLEHVPRREAHRAPKAVAPLFISDPYKRSFRDIFATHPNIDERIRRLEAMQ